MNIRASLPLILLGLALGGCASKETLNSETVAVNRQFDELKQTLAGMAESEKQQEARLAKLESQTDTRMKLLEENDAGLRTDLNKAIEDMHGQTETSLSQAERDAKQSQDIEALNSQIAKVDGNLNKLVAGTIDQATRSAQFQSAQEQLAKRVDAQAAALEQTKETAEDAIKIARDSRRVSGKVIQRLELTSDMVLFDYERPDLSASGKAALDDLVAKVKPELPYIFIEIIGHSDDLSLGSINYKIAEDRAKSVERYLHEVGGIPLHRMSIISYGNSQPVDNSPTVEARIHNRRVTVQVLK
jgi:peptidoglycan-associated lipoprotein